MLIWSLAQSGSTPVSSLAPQDKALIQLMLIGAILAVGLLVVIGLIIAWRNYNQRQRDLDEAREEREGDAPRPDAWATAAQRIESEDAGPDEAHIAQDDDNPDEYSDDHDPPGYNEPEDDEDDEDDFPFDTGDDEDDDGPVGRA